MQTKYRKFGGFEAEDNFGSAHTLTVYGIVINGVEVGYVSKNYLDPDRGWEARGGGRFASARTRGGATALLLRKAGLA